MSGWAFLLLLAVGLVYGIDDEEPGLGNVTEIKEENECFTAPPEACPLLSEQCRCKRIDNESAVCCNISASFFLKEGLSCLANGLVVHKLHIQNATLPDLYVEKLAQLPLTSLTISNSRIERLNSTPAWPKLQCLNLSDNVIRHVHSDAFTHLQSLDFVGLAKVNLTKLPRFKHNVTLDLSGRSKLECSTLLEYLHNPNIKFVKENETFCFSPKSFHWFNSTEILSLTQIRIFQNVRQFCIPSCECQPTSIDLVQGFKPRISLHVDCSSRGLQELPQGMPPNTISLNISNNNITTLDPLGYDPAYENLRELWADSNQITSILGLEGSKFIVNFLVLSLRNNQIKSVPTYILSNTFDRNFHLRTVNLGMNRFSCDCSAAQVLKVWLLRNKKHIPDYDQIECGNMDEKVVDLDINKVCVYERDWTDYIYYIIAGEVGLLLLLVSKVSYDYWVFKTAGYLPWPASKMPKLPCDWVFE